MYLLFQDKGRDKESMEMTEDLDTIKEKLRTSLHYNCGETCPKHCSIYAKVEKIE